MPGCKQIVFHFFFSFFFQSCLLTDVIETQKPARRSRLICIQLSGKSMLHELIFFFFFWRETCSACKLDRSRMVEANPISPTPNRVSFILSQFSEAVYTNNFSC